MNATDGTSAQPASSSRTLPPLGVDRVESTVLRIAVVAQLRKRREAAGVSREEAAYLIRSSGAKVSRMELGRHRFKERDLIDLLVCYGADQAEREEFLELARQANAPGWWQRYGDLLPSWFETYVAMEQAASVIRTYEVQFVPGCCRPTSTPVPSFGSRTAARTKWSDASTSVADAGGSDVLDCPAAVGRDRRGGAAPPPGGGPLCRQQVEHLLELAELPNVSCRSPRSTAGSTRRPAAPSPSCVSRCRTCRTWCTSSTSTVRCTWTRPPTSRTTSTCGTGCAPISIRRSIVGPHWSGSGLRCAGTPDPDRTCEPCERRRAGHDRGCDRHRPDGASHRSHVELLPGRQGQLPGRSRRGRGDARGLPAVCDQGPHVPLLPVPRGPIPHPRGGRRGSSSTSAPGSRPPRTPTRWRRGSPRSHASSTSTTTRSFWPTPARC